MLVTTEFIKKLKNINNRLDFDLIGQAHDFVAERHKAQTRKSGEPYLVHLEEVACILARLGLDSTSVTAGLLHDVVEDTEVSIDDIKDRFGEEIALLVEGATKIKDVKFKSYHEKQADYYRRLLLTMVEDVRVIMIKLADRLHNMNTLQYHDSEDKQRRIARETMDIYAPLAHRFGLAEIKWELEDLSFKYLNRKEYSTISKKLEEKRPEREEFIKKIMTPIRTILSDTGVDGIILGRPKHIYSIYRKMIRRKKAFEELDDLYALRIIIGAKKTAVETYLDNHDLEEEKHIPTPILKELGADDENRTRREIGNCYYVLGLIHQTFAPVPGTFDDYIASPKANGYQSLHTTIMTPEGKKVEIQIRTNDMHRVAEQGIAAHWRYKEGASQEDYIDQIVPWIREILMMGDDAENSREFVSLLKRSLQTRRIVVFTPRGEALQLPKGSYPLDFAFAIHTEVGLHYRGAKVNGRIVNLRYQLQKGDVIEIMTSPHARPSQEWLNYVRSSKARSKIRSCLTDQEFEHHVVLGQERFVKQLKTMHVDAPSEKNMGEVMAKFKVKTVADFYAGIGSGKISLAAVMKHYEPLMPKKDTPEKPLEDEVDQLETIAESIRKESTSTIVIDGIDNVMMRIASCCQPVPGDEVVGFITRGRGITIHHKECTNLTKFLKSQQDRLVDLSWGMKQEQSFLVKILIEGRSRRELLADISQAILTQEINVRKNETRSSGKNFTGKYLLEVKNHGQLDKLLKRLSRIKGVENVGRENIFKKK